MCRLVVSWRLVVVVVHLVPSHVLEAHYHLPADEHVHEVLEIIADARHTRQVLVWLEPALALRFQLEL